MSSSNSRSGEQVEHLQLEKLKRFQRAFAWKFENHPCVFLENFGVLIEDWVGQLPDLHGIFTKDEIDRILVACIESISRYRHVVEFVARSGYRDQPESDEDGKPLVRRTTAVHEIAKIPCNRLNVEVLKDLFAIYDKFHVNYTDDRSGYTHLYVACKYGLLDVAERFLELGADPDYLVPGTGGETLLHHFAVAEYPEKSLLRMLLSHDADPNLANEDGTTALHAICRKRQVPGRRSTMWTLFECVDELQRQQWTTSLLLDAQDNRGDTPLHLALRQLDYDTQSMVRGLLKRGADPNLANAKGQTALHAVCRCDAENEDSFLKINNSSMKRQDHIRKLLENYSRNVLFVFDNRRKELMQLLLDVCDENERTLRIDARDNEGNAALHLAVARGRPQLTELLLRRGADPGLGNEKGTTPLHLVARRDAHHGSTMLKLFFESTSSEERLWIDARDDEGRTALEWAVARCCPRNVEMLLDRGADLASFVFPTASDSDRNAEDIGARSPVMKLVAATGLLAIVELLEKRGYELDRNDALKVMGFFDEYKLFLTSRYGPVVAQRVDLLFKEMAKNSTYSGYYEFARSCEQRLQMNGEFVEDCCSRLCEKVSRKFFRDWALDSFMELTHHRLPLLCCEMIFEELWNRDLFNICLAAAGRSSRR